MEGNKNVTPTVKKPSAAFCHVWFALLLFVSLSPILISAYFCIRSGWPLRYSGFLAALILADALPILIVDTLPIFAYALLLVLWVILRKKTAFPGKWVALSALPIFLCLLPYIWILLTQYVTFNLVMIIRFVPAIVTLVLWVSCTRSLNHKSSTPTFTSPTVAIPVIPTVAVPAPQAQGEQVILERAYFFNLLKITVTNKRVMYKGILWKRVNLPLNRISAVGTGIFCSLHVGSSAGRIFVIFFGRYREVYETISALLNNVE